MTFKKLFETPVGADLSRPAPIYRPSVHVSLSGLFCETSLLRPSYPLETVETPETVKQ